MIPAVGAVGQKNNRNAAREVESSACLPDTPDLLTLRRRLAVNGARRGREAPPSLRITLLQRMQGAGRQRPGK